MRCPDLTAAVREGTRRSAFNCDADKPLALHRYARCERPCCFGKINGVADSKRCYPAWILRQPPGGKHFVYILRDADARAAYVGYTRNPRRRFKQRWDKARRRSGEVLVVARARSSR